MRGGKLKSRLEKSLELTEDLVVHLDEAALGLDLPGLPSNRIADQFWCIVGARESYALAISASAWVGFSCSLKAPRDKQAVLSALRTSHQAIKSIDFTVFSEIQTELAFALLEHEVQHHGQLIRYVYANKLAFPESWNKKYTV